MANISLKKDYQDGQVLYGSDLNANNDVTEQGVNDNYRLILELQQDKADVSNVAEQVQELQTQINNKADRSEIPTKVSQLENDENFVDATYVNNAIDNLELPVASETVLGVIKVGDNLTIEADGTLNATGGGTGTIPVATADTLGGIKVGNGLSITADGTLSSTSGGSYVLPPATEDTLGGIKVGENLEVESDGTLNAKAGGTKTYTEQPIPPYNVGDLWTNGEELYVCQTAKADGEEFASLDWKLTTNYASQITNINQTVDGALEDIASLNTSYNNLNNNLQTNYTPTEQIDAKNEEQDAAIQETNEKITDLENKIENQTQLGYLLFTKGEFEGEQSTDIYWVGD